MLTQARLKELLHYSPKTGLFTWLVNRGGKRAGDTAGNTQDDYIHIRIDSTLYKAHRLAWFYIHGYFPEYGLDHKDRIRYHNWISNLREATQQCNIRNTGNFKHNKSGVKGVCWDTNRKKWLAAVHVAGKTKLLGRYNNFINAVCARLFAEQCLNWTNCDVASPAYTFLKENL